MDSAVESTVMLDTAQFGGWEAHTRGIGSKLMLKMGYEYGKGKRINQIYKVTISTAMYCLFFNQCLLSPQA